MRMRTIIPARAETRTRAIAAPPAAVLDVVADARRLPEWAPAFARAVTPDGGHWRVDTGAGELVIDMVVSREAGTVDLVRAGGGTDVGARLRALASGGGTELLFTIIFPDGAGEDAIAAQMAVVERELETVGGLAEAAVAATA
jgi:uncharacterized protein YndB with AHSA1/START domain